MNTATTYDSYVDCGKGTWRGPNGIIKKFGGFYHSYTHNMQTIGRPQQDFDDAVRNCERDA